MSAGGAAAERPPLLGLDRAALSDICEQLGAARYRGGQLAQWLYRHGVADLAAMSNLPSDLRARLAERYQIGRAKLADSLAAADGTRKLLFELADGERVEAVLLPYDDRRSLCVSSQTGCAVGCTFCATGYLGAGRNLTVGELTAQLLGARDIAPGRISHVVFMGMGEPLLNLANVTAAVRLWRDELELSPRHVTISTVGLPDRIAQLASTDLPVTLAVSLHAADDALRQALIPTVARRWTVAQVLAAARAWQAASGRRVTYEVVLLADVNDRPVDAHALARVLHRGEHVNLIPFNPVPEAPFRRPDSTRVTAFRQVLEARGLVVTQRQTRGDKIAGACGQLRAAAR